MLIESPPREPVLNIEIEPSTETMPMSVQILVNKRMTEKTKKNGRYEEASELNDLSTAEQSFVPSFSKTNKFDRDLCMLLSKNDDLESDEFMPYQDDEEETKEPAIKDSL